MADICVSKIRILSCTIYYPFHSGAFQVSNNLFQSKSIALVRFNIKLREFGDSI